MTVCPYIAQHNTPKTVRLTLFLNTRRGHTKRHYCSAVFSSDGESLYCGSTSGDVASFGVSGCVLRALAPVCGGGALVLVNDPSEQVSNFPTQFVPPLRLRIRD